MPQQLLPETFLNNTTHLYLPEVKARSMLLYGMVLYGMVLLAVVGAAVAAFFVKIDVSFAAAGAVGGRKNRDSLIGEWARSA